MIGKNLRENNVTIAFNVFYAKKEKIYPAHVSNRNSNRQKQFILLMIPNGEKRTTMALSCSKEAISIINRNNF